MFALPNITLTESIETEEVALVSTADPRVNEIASAQPAFQTYIDCFKTEFGRSIAPSLILCHKDGPPAFRGVEALAAFRDTISMSIIPFSWARSLRFGPGNSGIHYSDWFSIYPWMLDKDYEHLLLMTMAMTGMDEVKRLQGQSSPGISPRHLEHGSIDKVLMDGLMRRWQRCYRAVTPEREDVALFRSLNMANSAALMPAGVEVTMYDIGRQVSLWVSAFEILSPAKSSAFFNVYNNLRSVEYGLSAINAPIHKCHGFKTTQTKDILPCWIYGELHKARNDFLHGNPITPARLTVMPSQRSLYVYAAPLYRLALTGFLNLRFDRPIPSQQDAEAFAAYVSDRMDFRWPQANVEAATSTILYTEEQYRARAPGEAIDLDNVPMPTTDLTDEAN